MCWCDHSVIERKSGHECIIWITSVNEALSYWGSLKNLIMRMYVLNYWYRGNSMDRSIEKVRMDGVIFWVNVYVLLFQMLIIHVFRPIGLFNWLLFYYKFVFLFENVVSHSMRKIYWFMFYFVEYRGCIFFYIRCPKSYIVYLGPKIFLYFFYLYDNSIRVFCNPVFLWNILFYWLIPIVTLPPSYSFGLGLYLHLIFDPRKL